MGHDITTRMGATMPAWAIEGETPEEGEWPKRDAVPFLAIGLRPAEVTPEMLVAGHERSVLCGVHPAPDSVQILIFEAMAALAPVPLVSDAEIALTKERDWAVNALKASERDYENASADRTSYEDRVIALTRERDVARREEDESERECVELRAEVHRLHMHIRTLDARVAGAVQCEPIYDGGPGHLAALARERDAAIVNRNQLNDAYFRMVGERDEARAKADEWFRMWEEARDERGVAFDENASLRAELMAAHDKLAKFTAQNVETEAPDPIANAIRDHGSDRRMVGR